MNAPDTQHARRARELYRAASRQLDPVTAGRLRAARREALASMHDRPSARAVRWLLPTGALAAIALVALMAWQPGLHHAGSAGDMAPVASAQVADTDSELPPDADKADPNLVQNLDFYSWLAANDSQGNPPPTTDH